LTKGELVPRVDPLYWISPPDLSDLHAGNMAAVWDAQSQYAVAHARMADGRVRFTLHRKDIQLQYYVPVVLGAPGSGLRRWLPLQEALTASPLYQAAHAKADRALAAAKEGVGREFGRFAGYRPRVSRMLKLVKRDRRKAWAIAPQIAASHESREFPARPSEWNCPNCSFRPVCDEGRHFVATVMPPLNARSQRDRSPE
jgi:hypothetical protein